MNVIVKKVQNIFKKAVEAGIGNEEISTFHSVKTFNSEDENLRKWFKKVLAGAFVPLDAIDIVFVFMLKNAFI